MSRQAPSSDVFAISKSSLRRLALLLAALGALIVAIVLVIALIRNFSSSDTLGSQINSNEYQAVLLANGQSFFGKLSAPGGEFLYLRHVYYLVSQKQPGPTGQPKQTLVKLGKEIQGPEDQMVINRSQIVYVENLKPTGQVSRAILASPNHP